MKQKSLLILALLCTVAQGVWATNINLTEATADVIAGDGDVLTGSTSTYKVTIAAGATVTLSGVSITNERSCVYHEISGELLREEYCIKCLGSATIILANGTTNTLTSTGLVSNALMAGDEGTTLTIQGTGELVAQGGQGCAAIGGGTNNANHTCGNIVIDGGIITAAGGFASPGIGGDLCRNCGTITINDGVTSVTAIRGEQASNFTHCIGIGGDGYTNHCGKVTIYGVEYWNGYELQNDGRNYLMQDNFTFGNVSNGSVTVPENGKALIKGTTTDNKITIGNGATVTLNGVDISNSTWDNCCIKCEGSATVILKDGTTNILTCTGICSPALWAGDKGTTLTIQGTGELVAQGGSGAAAIGGGCNNTSQTCGNIEIQGGIITATGGLDCPGIGSDQNACCGNITITGGVTRLTAKKAGSCRNSIGKGNYNGGSTKPSCGTVTIDGTVYWDGSEYVNNGGYYLGQSKFLLASINDGPIEVPGYAGAIIRGSGEVTSNQITLGNEVYAALCGVNISNNGFCVKCEGSANVILKDKTMNKLTSTGIYPALGAGGKETTLVIEGTGALVAQGGSWCAAIGGGHYNTDNTCGDIVIRGGIIDATGGFAAPGIGADERKKCGDITIINDVTYLTAKKGTDAIDCIGKGSGPNSYCGTVTIGGVEYYDGTNYQNNGGAYIASDALAYLKANQGATGEYWTTFYNEAGNFLATEGTQVFKADLNGETLTLAPISDRIVNSSQGVILKSNSGNFFMTASNRGTQSEGGYDGNCLQGTSTTITNPGNVYGLGGKYGVGFYKLSAAGTIGAHKAYLVYDENAQTSAAHAIDYFLFEETTGIDEVSIQKKEVRGDYFDLQGRKIAQPSKGLYIVNGKKVFIK